MADLFTRLLAVVLLKAGPQDMPAGSHATVMAIIFYLLATVASMWIGNTPDNAVGVLTIAVILPLILVRIVLGLRKRPERWAQTLTALFGTSAVLSLIGLPLASMAGMENPPVMAILMSLVLFIWSFVVDAHIWRHALDVAFVTGLAVAVVLFATSLIVIQSIAGPL